MGEPEGEKEKLLDTMFSGPDRTTLTVRWNQGNLNGVIDMLKGKGITSQTDINEILTDLTKETEPRNFGDILFEDVDITSKKVSDLSTLIHRDVKFRIAWDIVVVTLENGRVQVTFEQLRNMVFAMAIALEQLLTF